MNILIVEGDVRDVELIQQVIENVGGQSRVLITTRDLETSVELLKKDHDPDVIYIASRNDAEDKIRTLRDMKVGSPIIHRANADPHNPGPTSLFINHRNAEEARSAKAQAFFNALVRIQPYEKLTYGVSSPAVPKQRFLIRSPNKLRSVAVEEIAYIHANRKLNFIRTWDGQKLIVEFTIDELSRLLHPNDFFRINRSHIISYRSIRDIHLHFGNRLKLILQPGAGEDVFVSRDRVASFRKWIGEGT